MTVAHKLHYRLPPETAETYVGGEGEVVVTTGDWIIRVHDGITPGGHAMLTVDELVGVYATIAQLNAVALSGDYNDLSNRPALAAVALSGSYNDLSDVPAGFDGTYDSLTGKPTISNVGHSGAYADLSGKPALFDGAYGSLSGRPALFDGDYNHLSNLPALFNGAYASLSGKPALAAVATSGSFNDLADQPITGALYAHEVVLSVGPINFGHGLGLNPIKTRGHLYIKCTSADAGYSVGDVVQWDSTMPDNASRLTAVCHDASGNNTAVLINGGINLPHKATQANTILTNAKWNLGLIISYVP